MSKVVDTGTGFTINATYQEGAMIASLMGIKRAQLDEFGGFALFYELAEAAEEKGLKVTVPYKARVITEGGHIDGQLRYVWPE